MSLPDWLTEENQFEIKKGKDHFLIRNRQTLSSILLTFRDKSSIKFKDFLHPTSWLLALVMSLLAVSISQHYLYFWILALLVLAATASLPDDSLRAVLKKTFLICLIPLVTYLPSLLLQGLNILFILRVLLMSLLIAFYSEITGISDLLVALKKLHFPDIILLQLDITVKYIYVFGKILVDILKGVEARAVGRHLTFQLGSTIWGILYIKAVQYGKDLQKAMDARGFTGVYKDRGRKLSLYDFLFLICIAALAIIMIL